MERTLVLRMQNGLAVFALIAVSALASAARAQEATAEPTATPAEEATATPAATPARTYVEAQAPAPVHPAEEADDHEPVTGFRMGAGLRTGTYLNADPDAARGTVNPQQLGFDAFMGLSFASGFYLGGGMRLFLGQKTSAGRFMAQEFTLDVGYTFQVDAKLGIRPTFELGFLRYGTRVAGNDEKDFGPMIAGGLDFIADVLPHLFLGAGGRMGFGLLGKAADDITVGKGPIDVFLQFGAFAGLRF